MSAAPAVRPAIGMAAMFQSLSHYSPYALIALLVSFVATPLAARAARRFDVMDHPDQLLKPHARPTPYLGGLAIGLGWLAAGGLALFWSAAGATQLVPILVGGLAVMVLGLLDDASDLAPMVRLAISSGVVVLVMVLSGVGMGLADSLATLFGWTPPRFLAALLSLGLGVFVVLGACNSANLIDGLDGLCAGVMAVIGLGLAGLAALVAQGRDADATGSVGLVLALGLCGACLGFLPHNFNPARIFMGDAGSMLLGYVCGVLILLLGQRDVRWLAGGLVVFALPVFDTLLAMTRRWRSGKPIFEGDRSHFYDQLVQRGFTVRQTALLCYGAAAIYAAAGLAAAWLSAWAAVGFVLAVAIVTGLAAWATGFTDPERSAAMARRRAGR